MARKKETPILRYTELLCLAYRASEIDVEGWRTACAELPNPEENLSRICARQLSQMEAIRTIYHLETGSEL